MEPADEVIVTRALTKDFGRRRAVDRLDLAVRRGEILGFLGPNGAGKSTTIRMLLGLVHPTAGEAYIAGVDVLRERRRALARVGAIIEAPCFYDHLTARKNLEFAQRLQRQRDATRITEVLDLVHLGDRQDDLVGAFSHGMRQRLGIARALVHQPDVVILDEPSDGLDPRGRRDMRDLILDISRRLGITVLLSSHLLTEMDQLCDRVAVIHQGRLLFQGEVGKLRAGQPRVARMVVDQTGLAERFLRAAPGVATVAAEGTGLRVGLLNGTDVATLTRGLVEQGVGVREIHALEPSLEELFLQLTEEAPC
jgi:ABC-type multidrug transport system ATPase subunit